VPVIFRSGGFRFFFYANEGTPREPPHIHVRQGNREAKLCPRELRELRQLVEAHREQIETAWNEFFS
jgi:hypothetical protein